MTPACSSVECIANYVNLDWLWELILLKELIMGGCSSVLAELLKQPILTDLFPQYLQSLWKFPTIQSKFEWTFTALS